MDENFQRESKFINQLLAKIPWKDCNPSSSDIGILELTKAARIFGNAQKYILDQSFEKAIFLFVKCIVPRIFGTQKKTLVEYLNLFQQWEKMCQTQPVSLLKLSEKDFKFYAKGVRFDFCVLDEIPGPYFY